MGLHSFDIHNVHCLADFGNQNHRADSSVLARDEFGQNDEVVSADGRELYEEGVLVIVDCILLVVGNQLLGVLLPTKHVVLDEVGEPLSVRSVIEVEIQTLPKVFLLDIDAFFGRVVL
jgi:hypothetical protein